MIKKIVVSFVIFVGVFCLSACKSSRSKADQCADDGVLLIGNASEPSGLDPQLVTGVSESRIISALLEGLITYHPKNDSEPEPGMAESWESNGDASQWVFHLRKAFWSNGDPVTANDFVYSWERILRADFGAPMASNLFIIKNAEEFYEGEISDFSKVGVRSLDQRTLQVTLVGPTPYFLNALKHFSFFPVNPRIVESTGGMTNRFGQWTHPENYVSNGPFLLEEWSVNKIIRVVKNPNYWDANNVKLNAIEFFPVENTSTEEKMFLAGQLHMTYGMPQSKINYYKANDLGTARFEPYLGTYFYRLNTTKPPLNNPLVRKALSYAIDRYAITEYVTGSGEKPAYGFTPPGIEDYNVPRSLSYNPQKAKALLAKAGYPDGEGFPVLDILINTDEDHRKIAEVIQQQWNSLLGIHVNIYNQEWKAYLESTSRMDYDIARAGWIGGYMDPMTFLYMWLTDNGSNETGWSNKAFDDLIYASRRTPTREAHFATLRKAEEILLDEQPIIPIYWYTSKKLVDPRLKGYYPKLLDNHPYKYMYF